MSDKDIKIKIEQILSDILSDKYEMEIKIKFEKSEEENDGNSDSSRDITK